MTFLSLSVIHPAFPAESYFITLQKLELKKINGGWVDIIEPDHKVDLVSTEPTLSFFNNGRVPPGSFNNFRVTFQDHGKMRQLTRINDLTKNLVVKKGSFINVSFILDLKNNHGRVQELRLAVDEDERVDLGDSVSDTLLNDTI